MATGTEASPQQAEIPEPIPKRDDATKFKRLWGLIRMGHEAMMLGKIQQQTKRVFELADRTRNGTIGKPSQGQQPSEDDMGVSIGNETHYHYSAPPVPPQQPTAGLSTLAKLAVGASLLTGGAGLGAAAMTYLANDPPAVQQPHVDTNTDTTLSIEIPPEDRI